MAVTEQAWLIDKSALARLSQSSELEFWSNRVERGLVHISNVTRLEIGYSAQSGDAARRQFAESPLAAMPVEYLTPKIEDRTLEIQILLADRGLHRGPSIPDLLIAATAELAGLSVLHFDKGFRHHCDGDRVVRNVALGATMSGGQS